MENLKASKKIFVCIEPPPLKPVVNPHALQRPRAALEPFDRNRAGSLREPSTEAQFKRNYSLRINELQANRTRQRNLQSNGPSKFLLYMNEVQGGGVAGG